MKHAIAVLLVLLLRPVAAAVAAEPFFEKQDLFVAGDAAAHDVYSNPHNLDGGREGTPVPGTSRVRKNLSVKLSRDEGATWPVNKLLEDGPSAYSDIAVTPAGTILCFYGAGKTPSFSGSSLRLARFNREWLEAP